MQTPVAGDSEGRRPAAAPVRSIDQSDEALLRRRARRLGLLMMAASSLATIILLGIVWLLVRPLL